MERTLRIFESAKEAEEADKKYYRELSPTQRMELLLTLRKQLSLYSDELTKGFAQDLADLEHL